MKNRNINDKNRILHRHDLRRLRSCRFYIRQISVSLDIIVYFTKSNYKERSLEKSKEP